ncbi:MAG: HEAT repeat domain-containing protein [Bacillota bacterium]
MEKKSDRAALRIKRSAAFMLTAIALLLSVLTSRSFPQINVDDITGSVNNIELKKNAVDNLIVNISSDNPGVKKTAIYYAGYYSVKATVNPLLKQMKKEADPSTRILIALSLYKLGDPQALVKIGEFAKSDSDPKVRRMCSAIFEDFKLNNRKVAGR